MRALVSVRLDATGETLELPLGDPSLSAEP
jgi:hypothetical protein